MKPLTAVTGAHFNAALTNIDRPENVLQEVTHINCSAFTTKGVEE